MMRLFLVAACSLFLPLSILAQVDPHPHEGQWNGYDRQPRLTKQEQLGTVHPALPKTRSGKIMRRILRKIATNEHDSIGDTSTLADPTVVESIVTQHKKLTE